MTTPRPFPFTPTRRGFVGMSAAAFATVALASCSSDDAEEVDVETQNVGAMDDYAADMQFKATEPMQVSMLRSEERRVGKGGNVGGWWRDDKKKKEHRQT